MKQGKLILEDGRQFHGISIGSNATNVGEVVFTTSMTGHQEAITDPSYCNQILTFTYPTIGNYGIHHEFNESTKSMVKGLIVKKLTSYSYHSKQVDLFHQYLKRNNIFVLENIDTRVLTKHIRQKGSCLGILTQDNLSNHQIYNFYEEFQKQKKQQHEVQKVSIKETYNIPGSGKKIALIDLGVKKGIIKQLIERNYDLTILPYNFSLNDIEQIKPDGILISNGPGDPRELHSIAVKIKTLQQKYPILGICLGHQILAMANGLETYKMHFGHRGPNHPVIHQKTKTLSLTSQNHGYAVKTFDESTSDLEVSFLNLNDQTIEGLQHKYLPVFSVQFHPEGCNGPHDTRFIFDHFHQHLLNNHQKTYQEGHFYAQSTH